MSSSAEASKKRKTSDLSQIPTTEEGEEKSWHPAYSLDMEKVVFVSSDQVYFSVDKELLCRTR
jgi:hypothetical protein